MKGIVVDIKVVDWELNVETRLREPLCLYVCPSPPSPTMLYRNDSDCFLANKVYVKHTILYINHSEF